MKTQAPIDPKQAPAHQKTPHVELYWRAVTYKTVIAYVLLAAAIIGAGVYLAKPELYATVLKKINDQVSDPDKGTLSDDQKHAKFVNLDGKVQVKKVNSVRWVEADFRTVLDKGDLVQTGSDANARITFADGTIYTVKPDTLVTVEENTTESNKPTSVAVSINHGQVDLRTPNWSSPERSAPRSFGPAAMYESSTSRPCFAKSAFSLATHAGSIAPLIAL